MHHKQIFVIALVAIVTVACKKDESEDPALPGNLTVADFSFEESGTSTDADKRRYTFTNLSVNASTYIWIFNDGSSSSEENPVHEFTGGRTYNVTLKAEGNRNHSVSKNVVVEKTSSQLVEAQLLLLKHKAWRLIQFKRGTDSNYLQQIPVCKKDNQYTFGDNGSGTVGDGAQACSTGTSATATFQYSASVFYPSGSYSGTSVQTISISNSSNDSPANVLMQNWVNASRVEWSIVQNMLTLKGPAYHTDLPGSPVETVLVFAEQ